MNPFRRPFSSTGRDNRLPAYSNGFLVVMAVHAPAKQQQR